MQMLAVEPHSESCWFCAICPWHKWESKGMGRGPSYFPCHRFRPWTERYHKRAQTLHHDPFAQIQEQLLIIHWPDRECIFVCKCLIKMRWLYMNPLCLYTMRSAIPATERLFTTVSSVCVALWPSRLHTQSLQRCKQTLIHSAFSAGRGGDYNS